MVLRFRQYLQLNILLDFIILLMEYLMSLVNRIPIKINNNKLFIQFTYFIYSSHLFINKYLKEIYLMELFNKYLKCKNK